MLTTTQLAGIVAVLEMEVHAPAFKAADLLFAGKDVVWRVRRRVEVGVPGLLNIEQRQRYGVIVRIVGVSPAP